MLKNILFFVSFCFFFSSLQIEALSLLDQPAEAVIKLDNRVLAKVNGKTITVMDVMKKMDVAFFRQFPEYASSPEIRVQFYLINWRKAFRDLVDKELILADAALVKLPISQADVRQELERLFGPNVIANLDKIDLSFEEARAMLEGDIIIRRMLYLRVNAKALAQVTPQMIRTAYEEYARENVRDEKWVYSVLSIRDADSALAADAANNIYQCLTEEGVSLEKIKDFAEENHLIAPTTQLSLSVEFDHEDKKMSESHRQGIMGLSSGQYSCPIAQKSRDKIALFRIFFLKEFQPGGALPLSEVEETLKGKLFDVEATKASDQYIEQLEKQFTIELNPEIASLQPFSASK
jgi:hypothetical protein